MRTVVLAGALLVAALSVAASAGEDIEIDKNRVLAVGWADTPEAGKENALSMTFRTKDYKPIEGFEQQLTAFAVEIECQEQRSGRLQLIRQPGTVNEVRAPFTPQKEGSCVFFINGTIDGKVIDRRIVEYVNAAGSGSGEYGDERFPSFPSLLAGGAGVLAAAGVATGVLIRRRRRRPAPASQPARLAPDIPSSLGGGRYEVRRFLGEGGMKRVFLAHDTRLGRDVAFAFIKTEGLDEKTLTRVRREAMAMARLGDHPNIVSIHDTGEEDGRPYLICQYLEGGSVQDVLASAGDRPLPLSQAVQIGKELCSALEYAHGHGVIHRDLKPGNVWLTARGVAKLGDFGLAVALDRSRLTVEGTMLGTVAYMPPEQAAGKPPDARSDLYSLGGILYEMVTGRPPFVGDGAAAILAQLISTPPEPASLRNRRVPKALDELILELLAKDPNDRPDSAADVRQRLEAIGKRSVKEEPARKATAPTTAPVETHNSIEAVAYSVEQQRPDLTMHAARDGTVSLMFTDIESSTPLAERLGDRKWLDLLRSHDDLIRRQVATHGGSVVDTAGDGFLIAFSSAREAVRSAIAIQRDLAASKDEPVKVRIGIHTGEAIKEAEKFFGRHVHVAARVASQAQGAEILISAVTRALVAGEDFSFGDPREIELKGFSGRHGVVPVLWEG